MGTDTTDPRLAAVIRDAARIDRRVAGIDTHLRQVAADVAALARTVTTPPPGDAEPGAPNAVRAWLFAEDPAGAHEDLAALVEWLDRVYLCYPGAALPSCWAWHPAVIEELAWLRGAHTAAYTGQEASWTRAGDWHDRMRPGVVRRIHEAVGGCELAQHAQGGEQADPPARVALPGSVAQIAGTWATAARSPEPSAEQLREAETYDRAQHRARR